VYVTLIVLAVLWGAATGTLLPRAAYRLSVEPGAAWRDSCPAGHPITGPARGWIGRAGCADCDTDAVGVADAPGVVDAPGVGDPQDGVGGNDVDAAAGSVAPEAARSAGTAALPSLPGPAYARSRLVPPLTALICGALAAATGPHPELAVWLLLTPFAVLLARVDRAVHRLPDLLTLPLGAAAAVLLGVAALVPGERGSWTTALLGGLALGACYFVLFVINPRGMGFGDVKLALPLGVALGWYGWPALFAGAFAGFVLGSVYGVGLILTRRADRRTAIPFGPFMMGGALLGVILGGLASR
jgi:leader peptidase (prepilin peptidase)/N-methyltransferase